MIRYSKFNRTKWDREVKEWRLATGPGRFLSPIDRNFTHYWYIIECNDYDIINDELIKIDNDYLFPDYLSKDEEKWYSIMDYYYFCKVKGTIIFPDKWLWIIRECTIDLVMSPYEYKP